MIRSDRPTTPEEETYERLFYAARELSQATRNVLSVAEVAAYLDNLMRTHCFQPEDYNEAMEKMRLSAAELTDAEHALLARLWRAALAAAASIDPDDVTPLFPKAWQGNLHWYYRMQSGMVEKILEEKKFAEQRRIWESRVTPERISEEDFEDGPF